MKNFQRIIKSKKLIRLYDVIFDYINYDKNQAYELLIFSKEKYKYAINTTHNSNNKSLQYSSFTFFKTIKNVKKFMKFEGLEI